MLSPNPPAHTFKLASTQSKLLWHKLWIALGGQKRDYSIGTFICSHSIQAETL